MSPQLKTCHSYCVFCLALTQRRSWLWWSPWIKLLLETFPGHGHFGSACPGLKMWWWFLSRAPGLLWIKLAPGLQQSWRSDCALFLPVFEWFTLDAGVTMVIFYPVCPWPLRWWVCHHAGPPGCGCCRWWGWGTGSEPEAAALTGVSVCKVGMTASQAILSASPQCIDSPIFPLKWKNLCNAYAG